MASPTRRLLTWYEGHFEDHKRIKSCGNICHFMHYWMEYSNSGLIETILNFEVFLVNIKSCLHVRGFPDLSKTGALWGLQNVTKRKSNGPCIKELEPKIWVDLGFLLCQRIWTSAYYLHYLKKKKIMFQFCVQFVWWH